MSSVKSLCQIRLTVCAVPMGKHPPNDPVAALGEPPAADGPPEVGDDFESLRWFWLPEEVRAEIVTG